jgi:hypothetical protein
VEVKNSLKDTCEKNGIDSTTKILAIAKVTKTEEAAEKNNKYSIIFSTAFCVNLRFRTDSLSIKS